MSETQAPLVRKPERIRTPCAKAAVHPIRWAERNIVARGGGHDYAASGRRAGGAHRRRRSSLSQHWLAMASHASQPDTAMALVTLEDRAAEKGRLAAWFAGEKRSCSPT
jgi:hypothetical protein